MKIFARWDNTNNFGDALNPKIIKNISGVEPIHIRYKKWFDFLFQKDFYQGDIYLVIGSILKKADKNTIVWGSGFISEKDRLKEIPKRICAVRGPLTRDILIKQGIECPEIYGDPALLYPRFYKPVVEKKYKLGIIPHFIDQDSKLIDKFRNNKEILIIDITGETNKVIDDVCSCERVASSSLHGIIISDAYDVPSLWVKFSEKVIGNGFKFRDYFASVKRPDEFPLIIKKETTVGDILSNFKEYRINIDLEKLMEVCPFRKTSIR